jgi:hypothetical protein
MQIQGEQVGFTGLEAHWIDKPSRRIAPPLHALSRRIRVAKLQQAQTSEGFWIPIPAKGTLAAVRHALDHDGEFENPVDATLFVTQWYKYYAEILHNKKEDPIAVHTEVTPMALRHLRVAAGTGVDDLARELTYRGMTLDDVRRVVRDEPGTWVDASEKPASYDTREGMDIGMYEIRWQRKVHELRAAGGIALAIDQHYAAQSPQ